MNGALRINREFGSINAPRPLLDALKCQGLIRATLRCLPLSAFRASA